MTDAIFFRVCKRSTFRDTPPLALTNVAPLARGLTPGFAASFPVEGAALSLTCFAPLLSSLAAQDVLARGSASLVLA